MKIASAEQMRQIDNEAINHFGIPRNSFNGKCRA